MNDIYYMCTIFSIQNVGGLLDMKQNKRPGTLVLEEIKFDNVYKRKVMKSGHVAKVYVPKEMIGRYVYVILPKEVD